jgi:FkbM family methyltransferase
MNKISQISIFLKCINKVSNWYIIPFAYYNLTKGSHYVLNLKNGLKIKMRKNTTDIQAFVNVWILEEYKKETLGINEDDVIIDVGGHIGLFTLYVSQFCKNVIIYAFEPFKNNFDLFKDNIQMNNLKNIKISNNAVAGKKEKIRIYKNQCDDAAHSIYGEGENFSEIDAVTISDIINNQNISKCNLLKLDCEGAEYEIFKAIKKEDFSKIEKICLEYHLADSSPNLLKELKEILHNVKYKIIEKSSQDGMGILFAIK